MPGITPINKEKAAIGVIGIIRLNRYRRPTGVIGAVIAIRITSGYNGAVIAYWDYFGLLGL